MDQEALRPPGPRPPRLPRRAAHAWRAESKRARLPVRKTYKLYVGGAFPRSESGRSYEAEGANVARASRKDLRDAVAPRARHSPSGRP